MGEKLKADSLRLLREYLADLYNPEQGRLEAFPVTQRVFDKLVEHNPGIDFAKPVSAPWGGMALVYVPPTILGSPSEPREKGPRSWTRKRGRSRRIPGRR